MDVSLLITLAVIFGSTLLVSALSGLKKDRCLDDFHGFFVTVERKGKRPVYGTMYLLSTGFEIMYRDEVLDEQMHIERSYLFYRADYASIVAIYRSVDELTPENRQRRDRVYRRAFHPNILRRSWRWVTNFVNTATDSLTQALGLVLGGSHVVQTRVLAAGQAEVKGVAREVLTTVGTKYDPLLERLIGDYVVAHVTRDGQEVEYMGILKGYTTDFVELMDVYMAEPLVLNMRADGECDSRQTDVHSAEQASASRSLERELYVRVEDGALTLRNLSDRPILLGKLRFGDEGRRVNALLDAEQEMRYPLPTGTNTIEATLQVVVRFDMIVPRAISAIRHRAARYDPRQILGSPVVLELLGASDEEEKRARARIAADENDVEAMVNLAAVLTGLGRHDEAAEWLDRALQPPVRLPDDGALARLLQEVVQGELRRAGGKSAGLPS
ncbi:MAG: hypothetical protein J7M15_04455 [Anaerolineae bacterium]|nr:hypothetical protein [Anaerolineae bacterium]